MHDCVQLKDLLDLLEIFALYNLLDLTDSEGFGGELSSENLGLEILALEFIN